MKKPLMLIALGLTAFLMMADCMVLSRVVTVFHAFSCGGVRGGSFVGRQMCGTSQALPSSRRTPGPIRRGGHCCRRSLTPALILMGRGVWVPDRASLVRDDEKYSRGAMRPKFCRSFPPSPIRGRRECRMRAAPAVSRAICTKTKCTRAYRAAENIRHSLRKGEYGHQKPI